MLQINNEDQITFDSYWLSLTNLGLAQDRDLTGLLQFQSLKDVSSGERKLGDPSTIVFNQ